MSEHHNWGIRPVVSLSLLLIIGAFVFIVLPNILQPKTVLRLGDGVFNARVISNDGDINRGFLSRGEFDPDQALLIVFSGDDKWSLDAKDINSKIDIVWLNKEKKVIYIVKNASPENSDSILFSPKLLARYIIQLPAGSVESKAITTKSTAFFQLDEGIEI